MPLAFSKVVTSVNVLVWSLMEYLDELLRKAVRVTINEESGTSRKLSTPAWMSEQVRIEGHENSPHLRSL